MFTTPTAFILGAGASAPYGYPLGEQLLRDIAAGEFNLRQDLESLGIDPDVIEDFCTSLAASGVGSIDVYLERVERHRDIGRIALAHQMLHHDSRAKDLASDWLGYIWRVLIEDVTEPAQFQKSKLSVVTFNYDTSVERFLTNAVKYTFDVTLDKALAFAKAIRIVHVYGQLPYARVGTKRVSSVQPSASQAREASNSIIVLHEGRDDSPELQSARELLKQSRVRIFLGFAYHKDNVRRLKLTEWLRPGTNAALGTTYNLTSGEERRIQRLFPPTHQLQSLTVKCLEAVRDCVDQFTS